MTPPLNLPQVVINYSPKLDLRIALVAAQGYGGIAHPDYRFAVECRLLHPTGSFSYSANDLYFDLESFENFSAELQGMQQGLRKQAALKDVSQIVTLRLEGNSRALRATLDIRESLTPTMATLSASFDVEYDLFVNKLRGEIDRLVEDLRTVEPSCPERTGS
jgi:hypothetical protein